MVVSSRQIPNGTREKRIFVCIHIKIQQNYIWMEYIEIVYNILILLKLILSGKNTGLGDYMEATVEITPEEITSLTNALSGTLLVAEKSRKSRIILANQ